MLYVDLIAIGVLSTLVDRMCKGAGIKSGRYIGAFVCIWIAAELMGYAIGTSLQLTGIWLGVLSLAAGVLGGLIVFFQTKRETDALKKQKEEQQRPKLED